MVSDQYQVRLVGVPRIQLPGSDVAIGPAQRRAVFAALALRPGQVVPRDELVAAVWGDDAPAKVTGSVYTHISALRRVLDKIPAPSGQPVLTASRAGYCLTVPAERIDVFQFTRLLEDARRCGSLRDTDGERKALGEALAIWQDEPLAGVPGPAAATQRARLTELWLSAVERHAELRLADGRHEEVVAELAELVCDHPLRENMHRLLMLAMWQGGHADDALAVYRQGKQLIADAAGIEPGRALTEVYERIKAGERPSPRTCGPGARRQVQLPPRAQPFVGRAAERERIGQALAAVGRGRGGSLLVEGGPGTGKTALLLETVAAARAAGHTVLWSATDELAAMTSVDLVCTAAEANATAGVVDGLHQLDRCKSAVLALAAQAPTVIVADDCHWARDRIVRDLRDVLDAAAGLPLLVILGARPYPRGAELQRVVRRIRAGGGCIELGPLSPGELHELGSAMLGRALTPDAVATAHRLTGGIPGYARSFLAVDGHARLGGRDHETGPVSAPGCQALVELITAQYSVLSAPTMRMLATAALLGGSVPRAALAVALDAAPGVLTEAIDEATTAGVIDADGDVVRFRIPVVREAFASRTPQSVRSVLHEELAARLARAGMAAELVGKLLLKAPGALVKDWVPDWLLASVAELGASAPSLATELLTRTIRQPFATEAQRAAMLAALTRILLPSRGLAGVGALPSARLQAAGGVVHPVRKIPVGTQ